MARILHFALTVAANAAVRALATELLDGEFLANWPPSFFSFSFPHMLCCNSTLAFGGHGHNECHGDFPQELATPLFFSLHPHSIVHYGHTALIWKAQASRISSGLGS